MDVNGSKLSDLSGRTLNESSRADDSSTQTVRLIRIGASIYEDDAPDIAAQFNIGSWFVTEEQDAQWAGTFGPNCFSGSTAFCAAPVELLVLPDASPREVAACLREYAYAIEADGLPKPPTERASR